MSRKNYNLAKAKLALYEKWHRLMQHSAPKIILADGKKLDGGI